MMTLVWPSPILQQGKILLKLLIVLQTNSQVSVYKTVGPLVTYSMEVCYAQQFATNFKGQGHNFDSSDLYPKIFYKVGQNSF